MKRIKISAAGAFLLALGIAGPVVARQEKPDKQEEKAKLLEKAECVIVIPSVKKLAFGVGADYGRGAMICRTGEHFRGAWGAPAMYALEGGSVGFQIGGEATDLVLLVMNGRGMDSIGNFELLAFTRSVCRSFPGRFDYSPGQ